MRISACPSRIAHHRGGYRDPKAKRSCMEYWFRYLKECCV
jgi:hypothetical protein